RRDTRDQQLGLAVPGVSQLVDPPVVAAEGAAAGGLREYRGRHCRFRHSSSRGVRRQARTKSSGTERVPHSAQMAISGSPALVKLLERASTSSSVMTIIMRASGAPGQEWVPRPNEMCLEMLGRFSTN